MAQICNDCQRQKLSVEWLAAHGARLTDLRRDVLKVLHHAKKPIGAYEIFYRLKREGKVSAPPAVYRVMDFLVDQGVAHKLQSISAYTACTNEPRPHHAVFLICRQCGNVGENIETGLVSRLNKSAERAGFRAENLIVEVVGLCGECKTQ